MRIDVIRSAGAWDALAADWQTLVKVNHQNTPFLTYEFQRAWWQHLGGGEWKDVELNILTARGEDGRLVGIAPLFRAGGVLHFIGSHEIADYLDFIARAEDLPAFIQAVVQHLAAQTDWQRIELNNIVNSSASLGLLASAAKSAGLSLAQKTLQPSPYLVVPATLEEYIDSLGSKQAHELRRKMRRAGRNPEPISMELVSDPAELDRALEDFFGLMTQEEDKLNFLRPAMRAQMEAIARSAFAAGWLHLVFLKAGERRIAGYMNFDYDGRIWAYNAGFNNEFAALSPGWLIMAEMVRWCAENGRKIFDFMRGGEEYKYRFGGVDRFVEQVTITRP
jgi:CelD/BcsL family acetyltransferase involved in cellulose biosynthesis